MFKLTKITQAKIPHRTVAMYPSLSRHLPPGIKSGGKCAPSCFPIINHSSPVPPPLATSVNSNIRVIDYLLEFINWPTMLFEIFDSSRFHFLDSGSAQMNTGDIHSNGFLSSERSIRSPLKTVTLPPPKRNPIDTSWCSLFLHKRLNFVTRIGRKILYQLEQGVKKLSLIYIGRRTGSLLLKFGHKHATFLNNHFGPKSHDPFLGTDKVKHARDLVDSLCLARNAQVRKLRRSTSIFSTQNLMQFRNKAWNSYLLRLQEIFYIFYYMIPSPIFIKQVQRTLCFQSYKPSHYYK
jgi:hypothetical protein